MVDETKAPETGSEDSTVSSPGVVNARVAEAKAVSDAVVARQTEVVKKATPETPGAAGVQVTAVKEIALPNGIKIENR